MILRMFLVLSFFCWCSSEAKESLKIYYSQHPDTIFQHYWRKFILATFDCEEIFDPSFIDVDHGSVVFIATGRLAKDAKSNLLAQMKTKSLLIVHLGDETYQADWEVYRQSFCTFREYYCNPPDPEKKIFFLPLACKHDFLVDMAYEDLPKIGNRKYQWSFVGQVSKSNREKMLQNFLKLKIPYTTHFNSNFDSKDCLSTDSYQSILKQTIFIPSPKGWVNDDCYRLYEALESGCIPIVERGPRNYFKHYYGDVPFIVVEDWSKVKEVIYPLLRDTIRLESIRKECFDWWVQLKKEKKAELKKKINELLKTKITKS